jgi:hypothetical protein
MSKKRRKLKGTVEKIIKSHDGGSEKAQINITDADDLYREIRITNEWTNQTGDKTGVKTGSEVDVTLEAPDSDPTLKKPADLEKAHHDGSGKLKKN